MWNINFTDYFYKICTVLFLSNLINNCINNKEQVKEKCIKIIFELLQIYSKGEIVYNKYIQCYVNRIYFFIKNLIYVSPNDSEIEFYLNSVLVSKDIIKECFINFDISLLKDELEPEEYDFIIYSDKNTLKDTNKICFQEFPKSLFYEQSNIKFL